MKDFRTLEQAKKELQAYIRYVQLIEQYEPEFLPKEKIHILQKVSNKTRLRFVICEFIIFL